MLLILLLLLEASSHLHQSLAEPVVAPFALVRHRVLAVEADAPDLVVRTAFTSV